MTNNKQNIKSGADSENYQANRDIIVNNGLSYSDVKEISMDVFEKNFYDLGNQVNKLVNDRAEKVVRDYLNKLKDIEPSALEKTTDPDIRANLYEVQKNYARRGDQNVEELLINLLVERTVSNESDYKKVILNQSLEIVNKLTVEQIEILTLIFILFYASPGEDKILAFLELIKPIEYLLESHNYNSIYNNLEYLSSLGCIRISMGARSIQKIIISKDFIELRSESNFDDDIIKFPLLSKIKRAWEDDKSGLKNSTILPVGIAIAVTNINKKIASNEIIGFSTVSYNVFI